MDLFSNTLNRFKIFNFSFVRGPSPPDPLPEARDSLLVPGLPTEPKSSLAHWEYSVISVKNLNFPWLSEGLAERTPLYSQ